MPELRFTRTYSTSDQRRYFTLPFDVPQGMDKIELSYDYPRFEEKVMIEGTARIETNIIDLGLYDEAGDLRGWSGSQRTKVVVSEADATPGYKRGPLRSGHWAVALGVYRVESSVTVEVVVRLIPKSRILLVGDLHMHTVNSDGDYSTTEVIEYCRRAGLDFVALTDHNNTEQNREIGNPSGITVIPGMEYTNYRGHANFYFRGGRTALDVNPLSNTYGEMTEVFRKAKETGTLISLNHPHCDVCPWEFGFEGLPYDMVELWNGPMKASDLRSVAWWHGRLSAGAKLPGVGGSDTHRIEPNRSYGCPSTFVHTESRSPEDILDALLAGRSFITASPIGPRLDLRVGDAGLGDEAAFRRRLEGTATVEEARTGDILVLLDGAGGRTEWRVPFSGIFRTSFPAGTLEARFYRLELYRDRLDVPTLTALTNPVYLSQGGWGTV